jgi:hypothetical protein
MPQKNITPTPPMGLRLTARVLRIAIDLSESALKQALLNLMLPVTPNVTRIDEVEVHFIIKREKRGGRGR